MTNDAESGQGEGTDSTSDREPTELSDVTVINAQRQTVLERADYTTIADLRAADESELSDVDGITSAVAARIKLEVGDSDSDETEEATEATADPQETHTDLVRTVTDSPDSERAVLKDRVEEGTTRRWMPIVSGSLLLVGVGLIAARPLLLTAAGIPLCYVLVDLFTKPQTPTEQQLSIRREISPIHAVPGEKVDVRLEIKNVGETNVPDIRVVDAVPPELAVFDGVPRGGSALAAGDSLVVEYGLVAIRGTHEFGDPTVRTRSHTAGPYRTATVEAAGQDRLKCEVNVEEAPVSDMTTWLTGQQVTNSGGSGIEFFATREYRRGDALSRIDWKQFAKTGDLTTIQYREQRTARVLFVVDARPDTHKAAHPGLPMGSTLSAFAAMRSATALLSNGHDVGAAVLGVNPMNIDNESTRCLIVNRKQPMKLLRVGGTVVRITDTKSSDEDNSDRTDDESTVPDSSTTSGTDTSTSETRISTEVIVGGTDEWQSPEDLVATAGWIPLTGALREFSVQSRDLFAKSTLINESTGQPPVDHADEVDSAEAGDLFARELCHRLPSSTQVVVCSPMPDEFAAGMTDRLTTHGYPVTVLAPDTTGDATAGERVARIERGLRLNWVREVGGRVIDWPADVPLQLAIGTLLQVVMNDSSAQPKRGVKQS